MAQTKIVVRAITLRDNQGNATMVVELDVDCDLCGGIVGAIHGHHLRTLHAAFGKLIEMQPDLCGELGVVNDVVQFGGTGTSAKNAGNN